ncbi:hypothetical protein B296_00049104 [Ensete ventricosum]|uniref:Uncharacterized protein n=1 Tax=Ensete ventricosum TaxID=4639 RepID=A0A426Y8F9_ENSVE|nr:hypothetical protein B296_00049104 [Ensete ventricosum]
MVTRWKQPQLTVPPVSEQSAYWSAGGPVLHIKVCQTHPYRRIELCSVWFSSSPSSSFSLPRLRPLEIDLRQSKSIVTDRLRVVTDGNNRYLAVPPDSRRSAYQSTDRLIRTVGYRALPLSKRRKKREKKQENLGIRRHTPSMISIHHGPPSSDTRRKRRLLLFPSLPQTRRRPGSSPRLRRRGEDGGDIAKAVSFTTSPLF